MVSLLEALFASPDVPSSASQTDFSSQALIQAADKIESSTWPCRSSWPSSIKKVPPEMQKGFAEFKANEGRCFHVQYFLFPPERQCQLSIFLFFEQRTNLNAISF